MKFLVDAHLPRRLCRVLESYGHVAIHTLDLPQQNETNDPDIMQYADAHDCIVTTKDADFVDAFYIQQTPRKLWLISTGNISNPELERLIRANVSQIIMLFVNHRFVEMSRTEIIAHL
jgi:predicted nuclease of predicted toxin-antitoxin system